MVAHRSRSHRVRPDDTKQSWSEEEHPAAASIQALFPAGAICISLRPESARADALPPDEERAVRHAVLARRREFARGRTCARRALARWGLGAASLPVGPDRRPLWPAGFVGSITHCQGYIGAVVAEQGRIRSVGLDAERTGRVGRELGDRIATPRELRRLEAAGPSGALDLLTVLWSAKESLYKCLYPLRRAALDVRELEIVLDIERRAFVWLAADSSRLPRCRLRGRFAFDDERVYAASTWTR
jgi:enterobactin synthetase component D / holo-[acyl-carrier protein] synthase